MSNMQLRYFQRDAKDAVEWGWESHPRQCAKLPTGSGKTVVIAKLFESMQPGRCLFIADQDELCLQPLRVIQNATGIIAGLDKAKEMAPMSSSIVIGSSQTLSREKGRKSGVRPRLERYRRDHFDYIISDEVHRGTDRDKFIWDYFETAKICGFTATPFRHNLASLTDWLPHMAYSMDILDLVGEGFAPPPRIIELPVEINLENVAISRGLEGTEYNPESVETTIEPYFDAIAEMLAIHSKGHRGIAFLPLIRSSKAFTAILRHHGMRAVHIDGSSVDREEILNAFEQGEIDWLCNAGVISTGVDLPTADAFLNLRLTKSRAWFQQARGRTMRVLPGVIDHLPEKHQAAERRAAIAASAKPYCLIFDLLTQNDKLGVVHGADDFAQNEEHAQAIVEALKKERTPQDLMEIARRVQEEREAALVTALERAAIRVGMSAPLLPQQVAAILNIQHLLEYVPVQPWEKEPTSEAQKRLLNELRIDSHAVKSKGAASMIISAMFDRVKLGYATLKQVRLIKQIEEFMPASDRTHCVESLTISEATHIIDQHLKTRRREVA